MRLHGVQSVLLALGCGLASCSVQVRTGYFAENRKLAEQATELLHSRLNDRRFEEIYRASDAALRSGKTRDELLGHMKSTRDEYGAYVRSSVHAANCVVDRVELIVYTQYEHNAATEQLMWVVQDGNARLAAFHIVQGTADAPKELGNGCL